MTFDFLLFLLRQKDTIRSKLIYIHELVLYLEVVITIFTITELLKDQGWSIFYVVK